MRPATRQYPPAMLPGICMRCRCNEQNRTYFIDTGVSIDWEGVMYLCDKCLEDIVVCSEEFLLKAQVDDLLGAQLEHVQHALEITRNQDEFRLWLIETAGLDLYHLEKKFNESRISRAVVSENVELVGESTSPDGPIDDSFESPDKFSLNLF